jgi:hypothetical protein
VKAALRLDIRATIAFGRSRTSNPERARLDRGRVQFDPLQYIDSALSRRSPTGKRPFNSEGLAVSYTDGSSISRNCRKRTSRNE